MSNRTRALLCALLFPVASAAAGVPSGFTLFPANTTGTAVSNAGHAAGVSLGVQGGIVRYQPGAGFTDLGRPFGNNNLGANGVNSAGAIVGQASGSSPQGGFRYDPGVGYSMVVTSQSSAATDISETGFITGTMGSGVTAFLYTPGAGVTPLGGGATVGYSVNASGQVAGIGSPGSGQHAFTYTPGGSVQYLIPPGAAYSFGKSINNQGQVLIESLNNGLSTIAGFVYTPGQGYAQLPGTTNIPLSLRDINNNGWAVGNLNSTPTLWIPGQAPFNLRSYVDNQFGNSWILDDANAINDYGLVVGTLRERATGINHGFLLQVPAPATGVLALGLLLTAARRRR